MSEAGNNSVVIPPKREAQRGSHCASFADYQELYQRSVKDPEGFWAEVAKDFVWQRPWKQVRSFNFHRDKGPVKVEWFTGAETNLAVNCLDRHLEKCGDKVAIQWVGNRLQEKRAITYRELHDEVCRFANVLKKNGAKRGDRIAIYMPMIPELAVAVLACARIGAIHSVVFGGFSATALADRICDAGSELVVTADGGLRGDKVVPLKASVDEAISLAEPRGQKVKRVIVFKRVNDEAKAPVRAQAGRDVDWLDELNSVETECKPEWMGAEDPLFILYTSGSTGKPKGALHTTAGYMVYTATTFRYVFDIREDDVYFCTADVGWVTGHSYVVYGPLLNGATTVMFEGIPTWPDAGRFWQIVDELKVSILYTAPTAIRSLESLGDEWVKKYSRASLRLLGSVGEPINPAAWLWYYNVVGDGRCPVVDTWWQTETGGILISPLPAATPLKPGSATLPFFGVEPAILAAETGSEIVGAGEGVLVIKGSWPGQMRTVYGDHQRFEETYFSAYKGKYFTGDGAKRDQDGYYWITGRVDDVINVSGHRFGTAEIESALVSADGVSEAAVVGFPHDIKGTGIYAFVTLGAGYSYDDETRRRLLKHVREEIGAIASPDVIHWAPALPKTRSGKIMRRILRKIASSEFDQVGDTTTLADPQVVKDLIQSKP